jgi:tetratricopeptide (TPR) repeat protein
LLRADDVAGAQSGLEKAMAASPNSVELYEMRGELRFRQGDISAAEKDYRKAIELNDHLSFDFSKMNRSLGIEVGGVLGLPLLYQFELTLDYRDGMVKFVHSGR